MIKINPKEFMSKWFDGMKNLSPNAQLDVQISFGWGNLFGFFGGFITMLLWMIGTGDYKFWWTVLILLLAFGATVIDMIAKYQQKKAMSEVESKINELMDVRL